eukprot:UN34636
MRWFSRFFFGFENFLDLVINIYLIGFGLAIMAIELPTNFLNRNFQNKMYRWCRLLRRLWGRAVSYFFIAILSCSDSRSAAKQAFGFLGMFICIFMLIMSFKFATIGKEIFRHVTAECEGEEAENLWRRSWKTLTQENPERGVTQEHLAILGRKAGRKMNSSETLAM